MSTTVKVGDLTLDQLLFLAGDQYMSIALTFPNDRDKVLDLPDTCKGCEFNTLADSANGIRQCAVTGREISSDNDVCHFSDTCPFR